jgi:molecular chaperone DnaK (HSP70)
VRLGIDFGTTRTVIAYADRGNYPIVSFLDQAGDAIDWYPSVVAERGGELRFGFDALALTDDPSWSVTRSFKRLLSGPTMQLESTVVVGSTTLPVVELLARFLGSLREAIFTRSNLPEGAARGGSIEAVIATPANAFGTQRLLTLDAFQKAGFTVLTMLNEPSAAGFEYTHRYRKTITSRREYVVVYDLGGGTFDASLVRMSGHHHDAITTAGINHLGGDDFDARLAELALKTAGLLDVRLPARALLLLVEQCREAKERLNPSSRKITLDLESCLGALAPTPEVTVAVQDFYDVCTSLVDRTIAAMMPVIRRLDSEVPRADEESALADIAGIYVVGGASALPIIARVLRGRFGRRVHRSPYPHAATAIGLAIASDDAAGFELSDRFSRNFGVFREASGGSQISYDPIFTREMSLPRKGQRPITLQRVYRPAHNVGHFRFFECAAFDDAGKPQGDVAPITDVLFPFDPALRGREGELRKVPVQRLDSAGPRIQEQYSVDAHGIVHFTITDLDSGFERAYRLGALGALPAGNITSRSSERTCSSWAPSERSHPASLSTYSVFSPLGPRDARTCAAMASSGAGPRYSGLAAVARYTSPSTTSAGSPSPPSSSATERRSYPPFSR